MRVCGRAVCGCGSSGGLFAFIEGMCVFVHVCVCVCVCVCLWVCVGRGGQVQGNVVCSVMSCVWVHMYLLPSQGRVGGAGKQ